MADTPRPADLPEGIFSILDTDLYKLTMQCCVLKYFPDVDVTYSFTNRTPEMKFNRAGVKWLEKHIESLFTALKAWEHDTDMCIELGDITLTDEESEYLKKTCPYLPDTYLRYLSTFRMRPKEHVKLTFKPINDTGSDNDTGDIDLHISGRWLETILYEIPLLALISETYFRFVDRDWSYMHQVERARDKGIELMKAGCIFSEFGSRRRRDYHTHDLVLQGLRQAADDANHNGLPGKLSGSSNVHFAMKHGIPPTGTVAHEWFMAVAAITNDYKNANETALRYWVGTFGQGVLGIALTDTFGTEDFLKAFAKPVSNVTVGEPVAATAPASDTTIAATESLAKTTAPVEAPYKQVDGKKKLKTYAEDFAGVRQDSGDPEKFIEVMARFYREQGITETKTMVFSDSLNVEKAIQYKKDAETAGFAPSFGIGTFFTSELMFTHSPCQHQLTYVQTTTSTSRMARSQCRLTLSLRSPAATADTLLRSATTLARILGTKIQSQRSKGG
jgi:nicotinate phosphoribosyltransferase